MDFTKAFELLKEGKKIRRKEWNASIQFIYLQISISYSQLLHKEEVTPEFNPQNCVIMQSRTQTKEMKWMPTQKDILGDDWEEVE